MTTLPYLPKVPYHLLKSNCISGLSGRTYVLARLDDLLEWVSLQQLFIYLTTSDTQ